MKKTLILITSLCIAQNSLSMWDWVTAAQPANVVEAAEEAEEKKDVTSNPLEQSIMAPRFKVEPSEITSYQRKSCLLSSHVETAFYYMKLHKNPNSGTKKEIASRVADGVIETVKALKEILTVHGETSVKSIQKVLAEQSGPVEALDKMLTQAENLQITTIDPEILKSGEDAFASHNALYVKLCALMCKKSLMQLNKYKATRLKIRKNCFLQGRKIENDISDDEYEEVEELTSKINIKHTRWLQREEQEKEARSTTSKHNQ